MENLIIDQLLYLIMSRSKSRRILCFFFFLVPNPTASGEVRFGMSSATDARPDLRCGDAIIPSGGFTSACFPLCAHAEPFSLQDSQLPSTTSLWTYPHVFSLLLAEEGVPSSHTLTWAFPWERVPLLPLINRVRAGSQGRLPQTH